MSKGSPNLPPVMIIEDRRGFRLERNGTTLRTPKGNLLVVPSKELAVILAREPYPPSTKKFSLSLTFQLTLTALDHVPVSPKSFAEELIVDLSTDYLLCRTPHPKMLRAQQDELLNPLLEKLATTYGLKLEAFEDLTPPTLPLATLTHGLSLLTPVSPFTLTGLRYVKELTGSLLLALLFKDHHLTSEQVGEVITLEVSYQQKKWGSSESAEREKESLLTELRECNLWFQWSEPKKI